MKNLILFILITSTLCADTIYVPDDYETIQVAIVNASDGDTVMVADGTYTGAGNKDIDFYGKAILLKSENGRESTIIDCQESGRGFYIHLSEDSTTIVDGFTIVNGHVSNENGGGILIEYSSPTIINSTIESCYGYNGGGFYVGAEANPVFNNCIISSNGYLNGDRTYNGGNGYVFNGSFSMSNSYVQNGTAESKAAGIYISGADVSVNFSNCSFTNNDLYSGAYRAGALYCSSGQMHLVNCYFEGNSGMLGGGAIVAENADVRIFESVFENNSVSNNGSGGAIYSSGGSLIVDRSKFLYNQTDYQNTYGEGSALYVNSYFKLTNSLVARNRGYRYPGIYYSGDDSLIVEHSTIVFNDANYESYGGGADIYFGSGSAATYLIKNTILNSWSNTNGSSVTPILENVYSSENAALFLSHSNSNYHDDDYRLSVHSPCIGYGGPTDLEYDLIGNPRINPGGSSPDVGCYETPLGGPLNTNSILFVNTTGNDSSGFGSIENPFATLRVAIANSADGDTIIVGDGDYFDNEILNVDKSIYIKSISGSSLTSLSGAGNGILNITEDSNDFTIEGFQITSNGGSIAFSCYGDEDVVTLIDVSVDSDISSNQSDLILDGFYSTSQILVSCGATDGGSIYQFNDINISRETGDIITYSRTGSDYYVNWVFDFNITNSTLSTSSSSSFLNHADNMHQNQYPRLSTLDNSYVKGRIFETGIRSFHANYSVFEEGYFYLSAYNTSTSVSITNCVFYNCSGFHTDMNTSNSMENSIIWPSLNYSVESNGAPGTFSYTLNSPLYGLGNISGEPLFKNAEMHDFSLMPASPAIDSGDPLAEFDPDSTRKDLGAFYFDQNGAYEPQISIINDVPDDQGGSVRINWFQSPNDVENGNITHYGIWRILSDGTSDGLAQIPAIQGDNYQFVASTINDSISTGTHAEAYYITAHTDQPWTYYTSSVDSGYSVDNIPPFAPDSIDVMIGSGELLASWEDLNNPDILLYEVFKDGELLTQTAVSQFTDSIGYGSSAIYTIRGIDIHENVGPFSDSLHITNGLLGDVTWDEGIDVLDATSLINMIIHPDDEFSEGEIWAADMNSDSTLDITDLPLLVDIIMGGALSTMEYESGLANLYLTGTTLYLSTTEPIAGIQFRTNEAVDMVNLSNLSIIASVDYTIIYSLSDELLFGNHIPIVEFSETVEIEDLIISNHLGERIQSALGFIPNELVPDRFAVHQNYPNPFNPSTTIQVDLNSDTPVSIVIYDLRGGVVRTLINQDMAAGYHQLEWDGADSYGRSLGSGIYLIKVATLTESTGIKAIILR